MEEKNRAQELSVREISLIRELTQIRKEHKRELEYEKFDGYELPPRTQFSMLNKPAVSIKYGVMKFNMACIRLFEGIKYVLPILHPNKKRLALIMCPEEDSASVEWARQKGENWVNKDITSLEFVENIFRLMNWNRECRYKVLGRVANSDQGLCMLFDLEEAIMFTPKPQEYTDPLTGEMKKKQMKFFPDAYKNRIGKSYNDYIADHTNWQWLRGYYIVGHSEFGCSIFSKITAAEKEGKTEFPFTMGQNQFDFIDYDDFCAQVAAAVLSLKPYLSIYLLTVQQNPGRKALRHTAPYQ